MVHPDVIDELIDWNLELSGISLDQRLRVYSERHDEFQKALAKAKLDDPERELAEYLLANGSWLAINVDPIGALDLFNGVADKLLALVKSNSVSDAFTADRFVRQFCKVNERGIEPFTERVKAIADTDAEQRQLIDRALEHGKDRVKQIENILEGLPELTKRELRVVMDLIQRGRQPDSSREGKAAGQEVDIPNSVVD